jgi:hypothetical protein
MVTVFILPPHALGEAAKFLKGTSPMDANVAILDIDLKLLSRLNLEGFANFLRNYDLKFW